MMQRRLLQDGASDVQRFVSVATASANRAAALTQRLARVLTAAVA